MAEGWRQWVGKHSGGRTYDLVKPQVRGGYAASFKLRQLKIFEGGPCPAVDVLWLAINVNIRHNDIIHMIYGILYSYYVKRNI